MTENQAPNSSNKKEQNELRRMSLAGKTLNVYRLLYREGKPLGVHEVQKKAGLSSPSLALYHLSKLVEEGWVEQREGGYVVDRRLFENMIRIRRSVIPFQATFSAFFAIMIVGLFILFRSNYNSPIFYYALLTNAAALGIFVFQTLLTLKQSQI